MRLTFMGAAGTVTGSKYLLEYAGKRVLVEEEDAFYANRRGFSRHHPALPLYTEQDARRALRLLRGKDHGQEFEAVPGLRMCFSPAGHILGAASVHVAWTGGSVLVSGDLGRNHDILMRPPQAPPAADHVVVEATYGDRDHEPEDPGSRLAETISRTAARGGIVVVPAFAVGRAQALLYLIATLKQEGRIPDLPVFLNSPMAADVTAIYHAYRPQHRLDPAQCRSMCHAARIVNSVDESRKLNELRFPAVIISASGMATGGRVVHHLKAFAPDRRNTILLAGYQAAGTRGAALAAGAREIKIHGDHVPVRAEVVSLGSLSAHADRGELLEWLGQLPTPPRRVFVTHGEPASADSLRQAIEERHRWPCVVPEHLQEAEL
jgi:metallo-beta-lactamase family protein